MNKSDIESLLEVGERISLECKKSEKGLPKSFWETYSSFANTIGGIVLLGVKEDVTVSDRRDRFEVVGVQDVSKIKKELFDTLNSDKVSRNILTDEDVVEVPFDDKVVLCITIPQADYRQRPIYINGNPLKGTFKRNYEGDYHCAEDEIRAMIRDSNEQGNDGLLVENYGMDDIDAPTLASYRNRFALQNPDHVWNGYDDRTFLLNIGGYTIDRSTSQEGLTLAGLLMFGTGLSIRDRLDNIRMDYIDRTGLEQGSRWSDRLTYDGRWENNLYNFFMLVMSKLFDGIKRPFKLSGVVRVDDSPVHKLIREALTNMIIHADYMDVGVLKVEKNNDCLVFSNPGSLKIPIEEIYRGGNSRARNPKIQTMLRMIGMGENIGSGFPTMIEACKKENWYKPILIEHSDMRSVDLTVSMVSLISPEIKKKLVSIYGELYNTLPKKEQFILASALSEGSVTNYVVQLQLDMNPLDAGKLLYAMVNKHLLISSGKARWTTYAVNTSYVEETESRSKSQGVTTKSRSKSQGVEDKDYLDAAWYGADGSEIKMPAWSGRTKRIALQILEFCETPRTLIEISTMLGFRDRYRMKRVYIDPLLGSALSMSSTEKNDPTQKYRTIAHRKP